MSEDKDRGSFWARRFAPRQIYVRAENGETQVLTLSRRAQIAAASALVVASGWGIVASASLVMDLTGLSGAVAGQHRHAMELAAHEPNADQYTRMTQQLDQAIHQLAHNERNLMQLETERAELRAALELMRRKLQDAVVAQNENGTLGADVAAQIDALKQELTAQSGRSEILEGTLGQVSAVLSETAADRDRSQTSSAALEQKIADLELEAEIAADRRERMYSQLENAVAVALDPLERMLSKSGRDVDAMVNQMRREYAGEGGPFVPAAYAQGDDDSEYERYTNLIDQLDRVHLMQLAGQHLPMAMPVTRAVRFTSSFGPRRDPINGRWRMHKGQDLAGPHGMPIVATGDGVVTYSGRMSGYGRVIKIKHRFGFVTLYAHLDKRLVKVGDQVSRNDIIGTMGNTGRSTGTHLHYEVRRDGEAVNPMPYMKAARQVY